MKTKEIDVWIDKDSLDNKKYMGVHFVPLEQGCELRGKLIIDFPEKEYKITKSQFVDIIQGYGTNELTMRDMLEEFCDQVGSENE